MRTLNDVNDKLKQNLHQSERSIGQLKRENEDLKRKVKNDCVDVHNNFSFLR